MIPPHPQSTRNDTLLPYSTPVPSLRSVEQVAALIATPLIANNRPTKVHAGDIRLYRETEDGAVGIVARADRVNRLTRIDMSDEGGDGDVSGLIAQPADRKSTRLKSRH